MGKEEAVTTMSHRVQLVDEAAKLPEVYGKAVRLAKDHLRRQVGPRPAHGARSKRIWPRAQDLAEAHVRQTQVALGVDENVFGL